MRIENIWHEFENDTQIHAGLLYRRPNSKIRPNLYVGFKFPERYRCIALEIDPSVLSNFTEHNTLQDIRFVPYSDKEGKCFLLILLIENAQKELFTVLCEDLIRAVQNFTTAQDVLSNLLIRIQQWQLLFDKLQSGGLSLPAQIGLYGELYFLRRILQSHSPNDTVVNCWVGPQGANQDFHFSNCAVEVKTTHGKNHQKIHIASERQLDVGKNISLFLYHLSVDNRLNSGETLNDCVDDLHRLLSNNLSSLSILKHQLTTIGYFDIHRTIYSSMGYTIRNERAFRVDGDFPRIVESMLPGGVGDLQYSIIISDDSIWNTTIVDLITLIKAKING
jgi:hypothetical protein